MAESNVFDRVMTEADQGKLLSAGRYNLLIGLVLAWGFLINWVLVVTIDPTILWSINRWVFLLGYFASFMFGAYLFNSSDKPAISFLGYNFVVVPFGLMINMMVAQYSSTVVSNALQLTAGVTLIMMFLGMLFPVFFQRISGALFISLLVVIGVELFQVFVLGIHQNWIDWAIAIIFCGYIGYDWGRANQIPKTVDNAIDSAAALYIDIVNLFLRLLRILGRD